MNVRYIINMLGKLLFIEALLMLAPFIVAIIYGENTIIAFGISMAILLMVGGVSLLFPPKNNTIRAREGLLITGLAWILMSLFGALPLWLSHEIPHYLDALFEVVSGFTTTGASVVLDVEAMSYSCLVWRSFTHWLGGMGVLVFALAILPATGTQSMHLMRAEVPGPSVGKLVAKIRLTARLLYVIYVVMTMILFLLLMIGGMPVYDSLVTSFATAGTGGFSVKAASIAAYANPYAEVVITIFMLLYSVNFNLYYLILIGKAGSIFKNEELRWFLAIVASAITAVTINIYPLYQNFWHALRDSSFQVATILSTTGFATANYDLWPNFSRTLLVILMFLGACSGSTGGGIKIARVAVIFKTAVNQVRKQLFPRSVVPVKFEGKLLGDQMQSGITSYMFAYIAVVIFSILLLSFDAFSLTTNFTAVAACINNIGPGLDVVGPTGNYAAFSPLSKIVLIFDMLAGRLELFPILVLFAPVAWKKN